MEGSSTQRELQATREGFVDSEYNLERAQAMESHGATWLALGHYLFYLKNIQGAQHHGTPTAMQRIFGPHLHSVLSVRRRCAIRALHAS